MRVRATSAFELFGQSEVRCDFQTWSYGLKTMWHESQWPNYVRIDLSIVELG